MEKQGTCQDSLGALEGGLHLFRVCPLRSLWLWGNFGVGRVFLHMTTLLSPPAETGKEVMVQTKAPSYLCRTG
jgi:hypothetical protein